jgi:hypothetical protein
MMRRGGGGNTVFIGALAGLTAVVAGVLLYSRSQRRPDAEKAKAVVKAPDAAPGPPPAPDATAVKRSELDFGALRWSTKEGVRDGKPILLRYNTDIGEHAPLPDYGWRLNVALPLQVKTTDGMPDVAEAKRLSEFEKQLVEVLQAGNESVMVAVVSTDGARQWIFYTCDKVAASSKLDSLRLLVQEAEYIADADPMWELYRALPSL